MTDISKILIANRGEIAVRVIETARKLGYRTVAVFSEADANARHVKLADEAVHIGASPVGKSYLVVEKLIEAAGKTGADAIHPGYGFLSENATFARACEAADITFIGPGADAIELMGNKRLAKIAMIEAGVPCIPGYQGAKQDEATLIKAAEDIGFPLMVKASAGGGGRGMRLVWGRAELEAGLKTARSEAQSAFGSGELILEKAVMEPRHIEIQVFADSHGNAVYLGERDCSIQRRHQKVVEEAPSPFVDEPLRKSMGEAAVNAALACAYRGAGTVEFLVDKESNFYFLEMNTRLQVEHPVTELVTGQDLVAWQLKVASGEPLPLSQNEIRIEGHAIEVRLYAEDPRQAYLPQTGTVLRWLSPQREGIRVDHALVQGQRISPHYDRMMAKIISTGSNREEARRRLASAVEDTVLLGVNCNRHFLQNILRHPVFCRGEATTAFIEQHFADDISLHPEPPSLSSLGFAAALFTLKSGQKNAHSSALAGWSSCPVCPTQYLLSDGEREYRVEIKQQGDEFVAISDEQSVSFSLQLPDDQRCVVIADGIRKTLDYVIVDQAVYINTGSGNCRLEDVSHVPVSAKGGAGSGQVKASMDGTIVEVLVSEGDTVEKGQTVIILEAMKMEHQLISDKAGVVKSVNFSAGDQVKTKQILAAIE
jgi:geranyl-CoA carboxylase alpha subunit